MSQKGAILKPTTVLVTDGSMDLLKLRKKGLSNCSSLIAKTDRDNSEEIESKIK